MWLLYHNEGEAAKGRKRVDLSMTWMWDRKANIHTYVTVKAAGDGVEMTITLNQT